MALSQPTATYELFWDGVSLGVMDGPLYLSIDDIEVSHTFIDEPYHDYEGGYQPDRDYIVAPVEVQLGLRQLLLEYYETHQN